MAESVMDHIANDMNGNSKKDVPQVINAVVSCAMDVEEIIMQKNALPNKESVTGKTGEKVGDNSANLVNAIANDLAKEVRPGNGSDNDGRPNPYDPMSSYSNQIGSIGNKVSIRTDDDDKEIQ